MKVIKKTYVTYLEWTFKTAYLLLALATFNSFLYDSPVQPVLVKLCLILGILTLLGRALYFKDYIHTPYWGVLALFCVSFLISIAANRKYGTMTADMKWLVWTGFLFFLLYVCDGTKGKEFYKKEFGFFSHIIILYSSLAGILGLIQMQTFYHGKWYTQSHEMMLAGFHWGRLWGVYSDPNYGGVLSTIGILLCIYFLLIQKKWKKIPYAAGILVNYLYILFCDSRTAVVALVLSGIFWMLFTGIRYGWSWKKYAAGVMGAVLLALVFLGGGSQIKEDYAKKIDEQIKAMDSQTSKKVSGNQTGRKNDLKKDVSNGRLALWESGIEVWATSPVVGTGYNSFLPYAKEHTPDTYAVTSPQGGYVSLHNEYLNILVYQGVLGFGILFIFAVLFVRRWIKQFKTFAKEDTYYIGVLCACVLTVGIAMMFLMEGMYTNSPGAFILWSFSGYLMHLTQEKSSTKK